MTPLSEFETMLLNEHYIHKKSYETIAAEHGLEAAFVEKLINRLRERLNTY